MRRFLFWALISALCLLALYKHVRGPSFGDPAYVDDLRVGDVYIGKINPRIICFHGLACGVLTSKGEQIILDCRQRKMFTKSGVLYEVRFVVKAEYCNTWQ